MCKLLTSEKKQAWPQSEPDFRIATNAPGTNMGSGNQTLRTVLPSPLPSLQIKVAGRMWRGGGGEDREGGGAQRGESPLQGSIHAIKAVSAEMASGG